MNVLHVGYLIDITHHKLHLCNLIESILPADLSSLREHLASDCDFVENNNGGENFRSIEFNQNYDRHVRKIILNFSSNKTVVFIWCHNHSVHETIFAIVLWVP